MYVDTLYMRIYMHMYTHTHMHAWMLNSKRQAAPKQWKTQARSIELLQNVRKRRLGTSHGAKTIEDVCSDR